MTSLTPMIMKSMTSLLKKAGVNYGIMDKDGGICCGRPMLMAGRIDQAMELVAKNTEIIKESGADILLLSCPICYKIFKEKYALEGIENHMFSMTRASLDAAAAYMTSQETSFHRQANSSRQRKTVRKAYAAVAASVV